MVTTQVEFYATANEQRRWFELQCQDQVWMLHWQPQPSRYQVLSPQSIRRLSFQAEHEDHWMLFLGRKDMVQEPMWRETRHGREIDFIKSLAVQFVPSLDYHNQVLLEGRISIMRVEEYQREGLDSRALLQWFKEICRSFKRTIAKRDAVLTQGTIGGRTKEWRKVLVSEEATSWRLSGRKLKQFLKGEIEFDVRL